MQHQAKQTIQTIDNLQAEIKFREKLSRQHVLGELVMSDYYAKPEHDRILLERVAATQKRMKELESLGVNFSPFLELGAERGQRSLVLANDFGAKGIAIDISYHQLRTMEYFSKLFRRERVPARICCDANHLPFKNNSFAFVFGYEFLHHFPSLEPMLKEVYRVLGNGFFYFDEEPFKRVFKMALYKQKNGIYSRDAIRKNKYLKLIESFISEPRRDEVEHGIIENNDLSLREWRAALSIFDHCDVDLFSIYSLSSKLSTRASLSNALNYLLGGTITGLCRKVAQARVSTRPDIEGLFACPNCTIPCSDAEFDRPSLFRNRDHFHCLQCGFDYPSKDGIIFLLPRQELQQLYPDLIGSND